ncbi:MAG: zinc ribbon domain-containing protein [Deltaproteobacteria bacterium]|nr:zinc ribbon domain-containing protein [Deltaproteobacteria bacterium]
MPIYEYACESCGHRFERLVRHDALPPECPECGEPTRKLVSAASFQLKGSGWYKDHYGLKSGGSAAKAGGE